MPLSAARRRTVKSLHSIVKRVSQYFFAEAADQPQHVEPDQEIQVFSAVLCVLRASAVNELGFTSASMSSILVTKRPDRSRALDGMPFIRRDDRGLAEGGAH
jgi:hypothetical protein